MYYFVTKNKISQWIDGILFNFGAYGTDNAEEADRLRKNPYVEEVIEQEPTEPVEKPKKARK